jgi:hypothetical protein
MVSEKLLEGIELTESLVGELRITEHEFARLNASPHAVKVPESLGGGRLALLEATHQIHCVVGSSHNGSLGSMEC